MNILKRAEIEGFRGATDLAIEFHQDVNFLIGVNGSGKTTAINLIAASLNADFATLDRLPFSRIRLQLSEVSGSRRPSIEVTREATPDALFPSISYKIRPQARSRPLEYSLDMIEEQLSFRDRPVTRATRRQRAQLAGMEDNLRALVNVSWLSVHRFEAKRSARYRSGEDRHESHVDRKIDELSNSFTRYFSMLARRGELESERFQKTVFLSLIHHRTEKQLFRSAEDLDTSSEKAALIAIFKQFNLEEKEFAASLNKHFRDLSEANKLLESGKGLGPEHLGALVARWRIESVVKSWREFTDRRREIFEPKDSFVRVINDLFQRKSLSINEKNELDVTLDGGQHISINRLSSGEKQMLIILGEALLQERAPWVYIADEPELSLHVDWQERLIRSLRIINPNAQIVFATHSPDIVSTYTKNVFDMERVQK